MFLHSFVRVVLWFAFAANQRAMATDSYEDVVLPTDVSLDLDKYHDVSPLVQVVSHHSAPSPFRDDYPSSNSGFEEAVKGNKVRELRQTVATCLASKATGISHHPDQLGRGMCVVDPDAQGPRADFIRFMQNEYFPLVELLKTFGCDFVNDSLGAEDSDCIKPCTILKKLIELATTPCDKIIEKAKRIHKNLKVFDKVLVRASRLPYIKVAAKLMRPAITSLRNSFKAMSKADGGKCNDMRKKADKTERNLFQKMNQAVEHFDKFNQMAAVRVELLCIQENFNTSLTYRPSGGRALSLKHMRVLSGHSMHLQGNTTAFHLPAKNGRRFLAYNEEAIDFSKLREATEFMNGAVGRILEFGHHVMDIHDAVAPNIDVFFDAVDKVVGVFDFMSNFDPVIDVLSKIVDSLKFLKCPSVFGPICDLDSLAIKMVEKLLSAVGIDIDAAIQKLTEFLLNDLNGIISDIQAKFPDINFVDIDVDLELFGDLKVSVANVLGLATIDPLQSAYDKSGQTIQIAVEEDKSIDIEYRFATGSLGAISSIECPTGQIPFTVAATATSACGVEDFTAKVEIPCRGDECKEVDLNRFLSQFSSRCAADETLASQGFGFVPGMLDESTFLYICITPSDLALIKAMPDVATEPGGSGLSCSIGSFVEPLGLALTEVSKQQCHGVSTRFIKPWDLNTNMCDYIEEDWDGLCRTSGFDSERQNCLIAPMESKKIKWNGCDRDDNTKYATFSSQYTCRQPERDFAAGSHQVHFHLARERSTLFQSKSCSKCRVKRQYLCPKERSLLVMDYYQSSQLPACPADRPNLRIVEVLQNDNGAVTDVTAKWKKRCKSNDISSCDRLFHDATCGGGSVGDGVCANSGCCSEWGWCGFGDAWCGNPAPKESMPERLFKFTTECLCGDGYVLHANSETGECLPCGEGMFRQGDAESCQQCPVGYFSSVPDAAACQACPAGTFSDQSGATTCKLCPSGTYASGTGNDSIDKCLPCPSGTFAASGSSSCDTCPQKVERATDGEETDDEETCQFVAEPGQYMLDGQIYDCPPGTFTNKYGQSECESCPAGTYSALGRSTQCLYCPMGSWSELPGSQKCQPCPNGTFHVDIGATSSSMCRTFEQINYRTNALADLTCEELMALDLSSDAATDTDQATIVASRLLQLGNGMCNKGPWNTAQCGYDGGDCCPETCAIPVTPVGDNQYEAELACKFKTFACLDPLYYKFPTAAACGNGPCGGQGSRPNPGVVAAIQNEICLDMDIDRGGIPTAPANVGDGVCDPLLNTAAHGYDGGDCCLLTCVPNPAYPESCLSNCECHENGGN